MTQIKNRHDMPNVACMNAKNARPAGPLFCKDGLLIRPTQDCSKIYGGAINLCVVEVLTATEFREREFDRIDPELFFKMNGLNTLSATDRLEVIDLKPRRRMRWEK